MKKVTRFAMFLLAGALTTGLFSCSSSDDEEVLQNDLLTEEQQNNLKKVESDANSNAEKTAMGKVVANYLEAVIKPTYQDLANKADKLYEACQNLYAKRKAKTLTQADIDAACEAFKDARRDWEQSEAFLYGAASDNEIDPHIDSWPLDHDQLVKALNNKDVIAGINGNNPVEYVYNAHKDFDSVIGFHGLEFVLFRNGANRKLSDFMSENEKENGLTSVKTVNEAAFAAAVSGDLRNMTYLLEYGWLGSGAAVSHQNQLAKSMWVIKALRNKGLSPKGIPYRDYVKSAGTDKGMYQHGTKHYRISLSVAAQTSVKRLQHRSWDRLIALQREPEQRMMQPIISSLLTVNGLSKIIKTIFIPSRIRSMASVALRTSLLRQPIQS